MMIFLFVFLGLISGLLGGMLGIGGGVVTVPFLYFIFHYMGTFEDRVMQIAVSTSLAASFITAALSTLIQWHKKAILMSVLKLLIPGLILGCVLGSIIAHYLSSAYLRYCFGAMAVILGLYFSIPKLPHFTIRARPDKTLSLFGILIGAFSSMLGIGGGSFTFPVLLGYHVPVKNSSATSSGSTAISTLIGSLTYLVIAWHKPELPNTFGYIDIPVFVAISLGSAFTIPLGVRLSHTLDVAHIKRIFGYCLVLLGVTMFII